MARPLDSDRELIRTDVRAWLEQQEAKELLRFITCGSVDDGKSTLIGRLLYDSQADLRRPARRARRRQQAPRHAGRGDRFRAAGRRPGRRARAGHHHRRRLSLLRDRQAQVHRRRHAGPRAIYAQHGHRRLDRRPRRDPGRCAQGRADPDPAALLSREADRHPPLRAGGEQDGPGRLRPGRVRRDRRRLSRLRRAASASRTGSPIPVSGLNGDNITSRSEATPWYTGPSLLEHLDTVPLDAMADADKPLRMPVQWVNRPNLDFRGFSGLIASGTMGPGAESASCRRARSPGSTGS